MWTCRSDRISRDIKGDDLRDALRTFSGLARQNVVIDPHVRGSVTVRLDNVPWDKTLDVILGVSGLGSVLARRLAADARTFTA